MGRLADLVRRLHEQGARLHRHADRQHLRDDGRRLAVHAGRHGNHRRPLGERRAAVRDPAPDRRRADRLGVHRARLRDAVLDHAVQRDGVHAYHRAQQHDLLPRARAAGHELHPEVPADPRLGHGRFHPGDVVHGPVGFDADDRTALHQRWRGGVPRRLRIHAARLPAGARRGQALGCRGAGAGCLRPVQATADGGVLPVRDDARRGAADHECLRRRLPDRLQRHLPGFLRRPAPDPAVLDLADLGDALHPDRSRSSCSASASRS